MQSIWSSCVVNDVCCEFIIFDLKLSIHDALDFHISQSKRYKSVYNGNLRDWEWWRFEVFDPDYEFHGEVWLQIHVVLSQLADVTVDPIDVQSDPDVFHVGRVVPDHAIAAVAATGVPGIAADRRGTAGPPTDDGPVARVGGRPGNGAAGLCPGRVLLGGRADSTSLRVLIGRAVRPGRGGRYAI